jgi:hypothetical protein
MLKKIKEMPIGVKLSVLFLLGLVIAGFVYNPALTGGFILVGLTFLSIVKIINYLIN